MTANPRKREVFANPFFVVLMVASVAFSVTALAYYVSAFVEPVPDRPRPSPRSLAVAAWLDRNAPWVLAVEFGVMFVTGVLAMATDQWFSPRSKPNPPA
jgi:hypothetical protein